jgi:uncharacterized membrane protein YtjA (UPF0391 family)
MVKDLEAMRKDENVKIRDLEGHVKLLSSRKGPSSNTFGKERVVQRTSQIADYLALFKTMNPSYSGATPTRAQCCRVLPMATCIQMLWVTVFFLVELTGGAGGTSGVAGTRTVILYFVYIFLLIFAVIISRVSSRGTVTHSSCLVYAIMSSILLASMLGSAMSTFGVEVCNGSATLGPVSDGVLTSSMPAVGAASDSGGTPAPGSSHFAVTLAVMNRSRCGIDSPGRGAKIVFEFILSLIFGLPTLIAGFSCALLNDDALFDDDVSHLCLVLSSTQT